MAGGGKMNEKEFWGFMEKMWQKGREQVVIGTIDGIGIPAQGYFQGHALLPKGYDALSEADIVRMGGLLFTKDVKRETKEAVMIMLAHQPSETALTILAKYCLNPDNGLEFYAQLALDECAMWNE